MKKEYSVDPNTLGTVLKTKDEMFDHYFYMGHPPLLIPGFKDSNSNEGADDAYCLFMDFPSIELNWGELEDQNGGEFDTQTLVVDPDGKVHIEYVMYDHSYTNKGALDTFTYKVTGYIHQTSDETYQMTVKSIEVKE